MVIVTELAQTKIKGILAEQNDPTLKLRIFVEGGGCSGFQYGFTFDDEQTEDDFTLELEGAVLLVDSMSMQYLQGATVDYSESLASSGFNIRNPNSKSTCGCGSSFSV